MHQCQNNSNPYKRSPFGNENAGNEREVAQNTENVSLKAQVVGWLGELLIISTPCISWPQGETPLASVPWGAAVRKAGPQFRLQRFIPMGWQHEQSVSREGTPVHRSPGAL